MKKIHYLPIIPLIALLALAFVPALTDFDSHSFNTAGNKVGMLFTNAITQNGNVGLAGVLGSNVGLSNTTLATILQATTTNFFTSGDFTVRSNLTINGTAGNDAVSLILGNPASLNGSLTYNPLIHNPNSALLIQASHDMVFQGGNDGNNNSFFQFGSSGTRHEVMDIQYDILPGNTTNGLGYSHILVFNGPVADAGGNFYGAVPNIQAVGLNTNAPGNWGLEIAEGDISGVGNLPTWDSNSKIWNKGRIWARFDRTNFMVAGSVIATNGGTFTGQFTNAATINYSNLWYSTLAARKTNLGRRATLEIDIGFVDAATGTPVAQVVIENDKVNPGITNTWTCAAPGTIVSTVTNHYTFKLNTNAVVTVTDISRGSGASVTIANSLLSWE